GDNEEYATTIVIENNDNVGGVSVEINVADLVADIEAARDSTANGAAARRRLEALLEEKRLNRLLDEDDDFYIDDL
ncbi:MAG: PA3496 family putative envelope integrity protein, partial [Woeseiaceae bacterium]